MTGGASEPDSRPEPEPGRAAAARTRRVLCASVLVAEALVVFFTLLVAKDLSGLGTGLVVPVGLGVAGACLLLTGLLRFGWAYLLGSLLQVVLVLSGLVVPVMFGLGTVFAALWFLALYLAVRVGRIRRQQAAAAESPPAG